MKISLPLCLLAAAMVLLCSVRPSEATKRIITFDFTNTYSPSTMNDVAIGDTIEWQGNFSSHPLASDDGGIPSGAAAFSYSGPESVFDYVVTVGGTYNYHCTIHGGFGMIGSFTVQSLGVDYSNQVSASVGAPVPNPVSGATSIPFFLPAPATVKLEIQSIDGKQIALVTNSLFPGGEQSVRYDASSLAAGEYFIVLQSEGILQTKKLIVTK